MRRNAPTISTTFLASPMAEEAKAKGNAAFTSGQFDDAVRFYCQAIDLSPFNHLLYSNRSAAYASLRRYSYALADAQRTVDLKPDWPKGYFRLGAAHIGLGHLSDAIASYNEGLELDPTNDALKSALTDAQVAAAARSPGPAPTSKEVREMKEEAQREKQAGNAAFKKKDFEKAIRHYTRAMELDDEDISFIINRTAVYMEMGKYKECIKDCDKAVERGRELCSDFKMVGTTFTQKVTALAKLAKCSKDCEPAIETFQKVLTDHHNPGTFKKSNDAEKAKQDLVQQEYYDPQIADEEREKGNECFNQQKYTEAVICYTEALRWNPWEPRIYSNRAACYTKLGALPEGLKDTEKCIELNPNFSKGYTRKGAIQFAMKEYDKALETYKEWLKHDLNNQVSLDGVRRCIEQIRKISRGEISPDELRARQAKGMQDAEVQNILADPVMRQVLMDFQKNTKAAQYHLKNPKVIHKIQKLVSAGIVRTR